MKHSMEIENFSNLYRVVCELLQSPLRSMSALDQILINIYENDSLSSVVFKTRRGTSLIYIILRRLFPYHLMFFINVVTLYQM